MKSLSFLASFLLFGWVFAQTPADTLLISEMRQEVSLPKKLKEISGLVATNKGLWTFNDSGGEPEIYNIDHKSGEILQTVELENAKNVDWEDITADEKYIYVGDIGNNDGNRKNLRIYRIKLSDIKQKKEKQKVGADIFKFYYPEQKDFGKKKSKTTNFDAETLVILGGKLNVFTKEWSTYCTTQYEIPLKREEKQAAKRIQKIDVEAAITGGDTFGDHLFLTGYTKEGLVIGWRMRLNVKSDKISEKKKWVFGLAPMVGQIESIAFDGSQFFIASENFKQEGFHVKQKLYVVPKSNLFP